MSDNKSTQYRVKALSVHSDTTQQLYKTDDIVTADYFPEGHAAQLVANGFLEPYEGPTDDGRGGTPHVITAADIERNPEAGFVEGETIYLPFDGFVLDDSENQAQNESTQQHDEGKVLVTADQAKAPIVPPAEPVAPVEVPKESIVEKIILPGGEKPAKEDKPKKA